jgi:hypothetical protein
LPVQTLIDKLTNESNTWLNACRLEDVGNYADATILYLKDAAESLRIGSPVRAALSCSCAADCIVKFGGETLPKKLYFKAAIIYNEIAKSATHRSIQEWLWSLQKASENFVLAGETLMAEAIIDEYVALAVRVRPSIQEAKYPVLKSNTKTTVAAQITTDLPERVVNAINFFLELQILV